MRVKCLQVLLFNANSNGYKYIYVIPIIQFKHTIKEFQVFLFNTNNSAQHYLFVCTQLNVPSIAMYH